ncbi:MAG: hypothetical protein JXB39_03500 [Deltaproteobacteria bacterium]|nr:hypothetical protein [Deltaproteobacteria bacterium]
MNRKIVLVLAIIAGVALALILLLPSGGGDADKPSGVDRTSIEKPSKVVKTRKSAVDYDLAPAKRDAAEERAVRRTTPYYQHVQTVAKRWMRLGNLMAGQGNDEDASKARTVARALRSANRADGTEEARKAALEEESRILEEMTGKYTEGDISRILANITRAHEAAQSGEAPPPTGEAAGLDEASGGIPAPVGTAPGEEASAGAP